MKKSKLKWRIIWITYNMDYLLYSGCSVGDAYTSTLLCAETLRLAW